jgi:uncharacterized membrane protein YcaP (DUF421 family)
MGVVLRIVVIYFVIMVALRIMGKREFGELAPFDLVVLLLIPEIVTDALVGKDYSVTSAVVALATLLVLVFITSLLSHRFEWVGRAIAGSPAVVLRHGRIVPEAMNVERVNPEEILDALHSAGLEDAGQAKWAILETDGRITVVPWHVPDPGRQRDDRPIP